MYQGGHGGYGGQPGGYQGQPGGYQGQPGGYQGQPGGYQGQPGGYQGQPGGYQPGFQGQGGASGGYGPPGGPTGLNPDVQNWFNSVDRDKSGKINAKELQSALINGEGKNFSDTACNMMIGMFDHDKSGTIDVNEFQQLYTYINQWLQVFKNYDRDASGNIEEQELSSALQQMGFRFSPEFIKLLMSKSDPLNKRIMTVDQFIVTCIQIQRFTHAFREKDTQMKGEITVNFDDFLSMAFSSGI